jgi:RND family efflux transporter MFP subunit
MFIVSQISKLRVYVNVPQNYVPSIPVGTKATLTVPEYPGKTFAATVEASAQAVEIASSTTRMQLVVDNSNGELMTGAFTTASFELPHPEISLGVPATALIFDQSGLRVATVNNENRIVMKPVTVARDLGKQVEVASGLLPDDRIVLNPMDGVAAGDKVRVAGQPGAPGEPETAEAK